VKCPKVRVLNMDTIWLTSQRDDQSTLVISLDEWRELKQQVDEALLQARIEIATGSKS
jgi:hypothetical protein